MLDFILVLCDLLGEEVGKDEMNSHADLSA
jgi:hypothetical protein